MVRRRLDEEESNAFLAAASEEDRRSVSDFSSDCSQSEAYSHEDIAGCMCDPRCVPLSHWGMETAGQLQMDWRFAVEVARLWSGRVGASNITVEGMLKSSRFSLRNTYTIATCGHNSCTDQGHAGGVLIGVAIACVLTLAWHV